MPSSHESKRHGLLQNHEVLTRLQTAAAHSFHATVKLLCEGESVCRCVSRSQIVKQRVTQHGIYDSESRRERGVLQAEQQSEASDVLVPLGSEQLHVDVLDGRRVVGQIHLLRHAVLPHLPKCI